MLTAWKQELNYKNNLSIFWKELIQVEIEILELCETLQFALKINSGFEIID